MPVAHLYVRIDFARTYRIVPQLSDSAPAAGVEEIYDGVVLLTMDTGMQDQDGHYALRLVGAQIRVDHALLQCALRTIPFLNIAARRYAVCTCELVRRNVDHDSRRLNKQAPVRPMKNSRCSRERSALMVATTQVTDVPLAAHETRGMGAR